MLLNKWFLDSAARKKNWALARCYEIKKAETEAIKVTVRINFENGQYNIYARFKTKRK